MAAPLVLIVEDEAMIRLNAALMLNDAGFDTVEAASAHEAIALLESNKQIRIVFTDINLPGSMDGLRLASAIRYRWPPIELILTSGHVRVDEQDMPARGHFLAKPYTSEQLIQAVRSFAA
jgi:CheY-like chemotaxis protein